MRPRAPEPPRARASASGVRLTGARQLGSVCDCAPLPAATVPRPARMNANLYALLAAHFPESADQPCLLIPDGPVVHYDDLDAASARIAHALTDAGAQPRRSRRRAGGQVLGGARALSRLPARRLRLPAAQHRLPEERARLPLRRRRAVGHRLRPASAERVAALRPEAQVLTLASGDRDAARPRGRPADDFRHGRLEARRRRGDPLHVRNDRPPEGRDAHAPQPREQRADAGAIAGASPAATCCCTRCRSITCTDCSSPATARCWRVRGCSGSRSSTPRKCAALLPRATVMMGVPTFYTRLLALPSFGADDCRSMRLFVSGSAPLLARDVRRLSRAHRAHDPRALRDDGNRHDHVESARRRAHRGHRRPAAARRLGARRRRRRQPVRCRRSRRRRGQAARTCSRGYWRMPDKTREEFTADGVLPDRRRRGAAAERLPPDRRPREGPHHHRRPQRLSEGNRGEDRRAPRRRRIRGHRRARCRFRRGGRGGRRRAARPCADRSAA